MQVIIPATTNDYASFVKNNSLAVVGVLLSLPLGVVLALGRKSDYSVIRSLCVGFIELIRGVPLITILFMASVMLPIFYPRVSI